MSLWAVAPSDEAFQIYYHNVAISRDNRAHNENVRLFPPPDDDERLPCQLDLDAAGGNIYYIWQEVKMGLLYARTKLHLVSENEGQKGVLETKLAEGRQ